MRAFSIGSGSGPVIWLWVAYGEDGYAYVRCATDLYRLTGETIRERGEWK
jgi:hypothetical protein